MQMEFTELDMKRMLRKMLFIRKFEERLVDEIRAGNIRGMVHLSVGQEAVAVGVCEVIRPDDYLVTTHRGHGHVLAKGGHPGKLMAELFGRSRGYCKGKGGSMHAADFAAGVIACDGIVGGGVSIATGTALASKIRGQRRVTVCFFGDGASNQGSFHESLNLASIWKLPVVYVCENNLYGASTPASEVVSVKDIAVRAGGYDIPGRVVDGNDVLAVATAATEAVSRAREGHGPTLLECKTYRWRSHMESIVPAADPYRSESEVQAWMRRCPIRRLQEKLISEGKLDTPELEQSVQEVLAEVKQAVSYALESDYPSVEEALTDVFSIASSDVRKED